MNFLSSSRTTGLSIISIVSFNFVSFISNGLPLAVLPSYVVNGLGFSSTIAGLAIGIQYLATLVSRTIAGRLADHFGAKRTVIAGLAVLTGSGLLTAFALLISAAPGVILSLILAGRILQGISASLISTPCCTWAIGLYGNSRTAQIMSWNGIAAYGGTAIGAPLGMLIHNHLGISSIGIGIIVLGVLSMLFAKTRTAAPRLFGPHLPFHSVFITVLPHGLAIACSSVGFGSLTAFVALYFDSQQWPHAAYCLSAFGMAFIFARLAAPNILTRFRGYSVVTVCLMVQSFGMLLIWLSPSPLLAILGSALTGLGVSWVYPGLAMETLARTPESNRNSALSTLSLFFDLAAGLAGPLMGVIAVSLGLSWIFFFAALLSTLGFVYVMRLRHMQR